MGYQLGIDLGTTYSAAAVARDGRVEVVGLGNRAPVVPSVVFLREDEMVLTGEAAQRRALTEPERIAREFKRRVGDPTPILLGGTPYSAEALMAKLLRGVFDVVVASQGGEPDAVAVSHPANWGPYKKDLLHQAVRLAGLPDARLITEPEAAAVFYASQERVEPGSVVAVYDLGGGTFDAAILRKRDVGFEIMGAPEGIERLGGIDFDAAVLAHVNRCLDGALEDLDLSDPTTLAAVARLRADCVEAKEALSVDTEVSIPVILPELRTEVRLTRVELEAMIRPTLLETLGALRRALASADVTTDEVSTVLLVGGSSRIPLVGELVGHTLGRPVAVDAHPKHSVALGAALSAAGTVGAAEGLGPGDGAAGAATGAAAAGGVATGLAAAAAGGLAGEPSPAGAAPPRGGAGAGLVPPPPGRGPAAEPAAAGPAPPGGPPTEPPAAEPPPTQPLPQVPVGAGPAATSDPFEPGPPPEPPGGDGGRGDGHGAPGAGRRGGDRGRLVAAVVGGVVALALLVGGAYALSGGGDGNGGAAAGTTTSTSTSTTEPTTTASTAPSTTPTTAGTTAPPTTADPCANPNPGGLFVCITGVRVEGDDLVVEYRTDNYEPKIVTQGTERHIHFYFPVGPMAENPENAGTSGPNPGQWALWDLPNPFRNGQRDDLPGYTVQQARDVGATQICALVADAVHAVYPGTGNCADLPI